MLSALRGKIAKKSSDDFSMDFKRTARNDYFVATGAGLGLFTQSIDDGICQVDGKMIVMPSELPIKLVWKT